MHTDFPDVDYHERFDVYCYQRKKDKKRDCMSLLTAASGKSVYRGYKYYCAGKVLYVQQINDDEIKGLVKGTAREPYKVYINLSKVRSSSCDCPFANGRKICKHMIAVFFAAFPDEAKKYKAELEAYYEEEEAREAILDDMLLNYIKKLSKAELQEAILQVLYDGPEWQFDRFIREYIDTGDLL
ncbi:MAG: SWIM zinc finger family protein [Oscillospiraceae bacterium]|nr:SWIM zinc finger family protein [Oscillospiraceae bacterium]